LKCFIGHSKIRQLYAHGNSGGCATTLAFAALNQFIVDGVVVARYGRPPYTFVAKDLQDLIMVCGSFYEDFEYVRIPGNWARMGQIGKPCDINSAFKLKISLFCSHACRPGDAKINKRTRIKMSKWRIPMKCLFWACRDHTGVKADISVGDSQAFPKENVLIARSDRGLQLLQTCIDTGFLDLQEISFLSIKRKQPYLFRGLFHGRL